MVPGSALQIAVAREREPRRGVRATRTRAPASDAGSAASLLGHGGGGAAGDPAARRARRDPERRRGLGGRRGAASRRCSGCCVSVERGALQGLQRYRLVALQHHRRGGRAARLRASCSCGIGLDVTGAFLGSVAGAPGRGVCCWRYRCSGRCRSGEGGRRLRDLLAGAWVPVVGLTLLFALQDVDVIVVKHEAAATPPAPTPWRRWPPRRSSGSPWGSACTCCPRPPAACTEARTRGRSCCARWP